MMKTNVDRYMHRLQLNLVREHGFHFVVTIGGHEEKGLQTTFSF